MNFVRIDGELVNLDLVREISPRGKSIMIYFDENHVAKIECNDDYAASRLCDELYRDIKNGTLKKDYNL